MKHINWKVRLQSKTFLASVAAAALVFIYGLAQLLGLELPVAQEAVMNVVSMLLTLLATIGIITDPTTPGVEDSSRARRYSVPGGTPQEQSPAAEK